MRPLLVLAAGLEVLSVRAVFAGSNDSGRAERCVASRHRATEKLPRAAHGCFIERRKRSARRSLYRRVRAPRALSSIAKPAILCEFSAKAAWPYFTWA